MLSIHRLVAWLAAAFMSALCAMAQAQDDPPGRVGRIAAVEGGVWVFDDEQREWLAALRNRPLTQGDRLVTDAASGAELRIGSTILQLGEQSELQALRLDDDRMLFQLYRGSLALRVRSDEVAAEIEVLTAEGSFAPQGSGAYRIDRHEDGSFAGVWHGVLLFQAPDLRETLQAGQRAQFWRDGPQLAMRSRWMAPLNDDFARAFVRLDEAEARAVMPPFVSPEMTGIEDLERYGQWQHNPQIGAVWMPTNVAPGWAPYRHGHWAWVPPWGWTWVDDAAWGFAPFHYGRWLYWGNRWCWTPGPRGVRPVYAPALVAWVGGPGLRVGTGGRSVPAVGWVPLAPHEAYRPGYHASVGYIDRLNNGRRWDGQPGHANRGAPGAVTLLPEDRLVPRQPVSGNALRGDDAAVQRALHDRQFGHQAPGAPLASWRAPGSPGVTNPAPTMSPMPRTASPSMRLPPNATQPRRQWQGPGQDGEVAPLPARPVPTDLVRSVPAPMRPTPLRPEPVPPQQTGMPMPGQGAAHRARPPFGGAAPAQPPAAGMPAANADHETAPRRHAAPPPAPPAPPHPRPVQPPAQAGHPDKPAVGADPSEQRRGAPSSRMPQRER